ncbi:ATP-binding protein [Nostoc sp. MG11]|uniref:hybrid sensor histidine kinase/response regulator n=1 Tax=Nostoc sp. MG11 TaxID=2721166 RepID=UPI001865F335|nr:ATP-binding protein [Nostoc sp. MG11]
MKERILVVEDETIITDDIKYCLEKSGYTVPDVAIYGKQAIENIAALCPDLVLIDMMIKGDSGTVHFDLFCVQGEAIFRIQDEGIGIPEADQQNLFNSFHRGSNVGKIPGHGLGLAIVKHYVELHGGEITFASKVGRGTTFIVSVPFQNN